MKNIKISKKVQTYIKIFGSLGFLIILAVVLFRIASVQIPAQRNKLSTQIKKEQTLRQKTELLRNIETDVAKQADFTSSALPPQNSSFIALSQLNKLAQENLIILTNLKIGAEIKDGEIQNSDITFDAEGTMSSVLAFLTETKEVAPIMLLDKVQINQVQDQARATVRIKVFWAELPKTLPAISEPLADLSNDEKEVLLKIVNLTAPDFVILEPETPRENSNPF